VKESVEEEFVDFLKYGVSYNPARALGWLCRPSGTRLISPPSAEALG
jgi:hypothetical protein